MLHKVEVIAHRGSGRGWMQPEAPPENTVPAILHAFSPAIDADAVEVDVRLTRDGELVAMHDARLDRTTSGRGRVADHTFAEILRLDAGSWKDARYAGVRVPSLDQVIAAVPASKRLFIEIKSGSRAIPRLATVLARRRRPPSQLPLIAFGLRNIAAIKQALPYHECYLVTAVRSRVAFLGPAIRRAIRYDLDGIDARYPASRAFLRRVHESGLKCLLWNVNDDDAARRLAALGVAGVTTDLPGEMRAAKTAR